MYTTELLNGSHLPEKTLCLTYDDGPGENTLAIARYLQEENIKATFFVVGKYAVYQTQTLHTLRQMGHIIGNHTYEHPDLPYYVSIDGDVQNQILRTDAIISNYATHPIYFRPPYGKWSAEVANELNINLLASVHTIGPVHWDIGGIDCYFWQQDKPVEEALESYLTTIEEVNHGIVVMHDDIADMDIVKPKSKTLALTKLLIPALKKQGYTFIGLDEVFQKKSIEPESFDINLLVANGKCMALHNMHTIVVSNRMKIDAARMTYVDLGNGTVALKACNGNFLSVNEQTNFLEASDSSLQSTAVFHIIPVSDNRILIRTKNGNFIAIESGTKQFTATAPYMRQAEIFTYIPLQIEANKRISFNMKWRFWTKRAAFIKRKLLGKLQKN